MFLASFKELNLVGLVHFPQNIQKAKTQSSGAQIIPLCLP
jgi:hypothetical protein